MLRWIYEHFDCPPDVLYHVQFEDYFEVLVSTHSWSTIATGCIFYKYALKRDWRGVKIVKPPTEKRLPTDRGRFRQRTVLIQSAKTKAGFMLLQKPHT